MSELGTEPAAKRMKIEEHAEGHGNGIVMGNLNFVDATTAQTTQSHTAVADVSSVPVPAPVPVPVPVPVIDNLATTTAAAQHAHAAVTDTNGVSTLTVNDPVPAPIPANYDTEHLGESADILGVPAPVTGMTNTPMMPEPTPVVGNQVQQQQHQQPQASNPTPTEHAAAVAAAGVAIDVMPVGTENTVQVPVPVQQMPPLISPALVPTSVSNVNMNMTTVDVPQSVPAPVTVDVSGNINNQHQHQLNTETNGQVNINAMNVNMNMDVQPVPVAVNVNVAPTPLMGHEAAMEEVAAAPTSNPNTMDVHPATVLAHAPMQAASLPVPMPVPVHMSVPVPVPVPAPAPVSIPVPVSVSSPAPVTNNSTTPAPTPTPPSRPAHTLPSTDPAYRRKDKSLGVLCANFMRRYNKIQQGRPLDANAAHPPEVTIDEASQSLMVERRRIYDIINILEAIEVVTRKGKNTYNWFGMANINHTLRKMQQEAFTLFPQDVIANQLHEATKEKEEAEAAAKAAAEAAAAEGGGEASANEAATDGEQNQSQCEQHPQQPGEDAAGADGDTNIPSGFAMLLASAEQVEASKKKKPKTKKGASKEKSLGRLSQKFIQLFLVGNQTITLEEASDKILGKTDLPQPAPDALPEEILKIRNSNNKMIKTKIRRLYDIANIMASVGLIAKMNSDNQHVGSAPRSRPSFRWIYPLTAKQILLGETGEVLVSIGGNNEKRNVVQEHFGLVVNSGIGVNAHAGGMTNLTVPIAPPPQAAIPMSVAPIPAINDNVNVNGNLNVPPSMASINPTPINLPPQPTDIGVAVAGSVNGNSTETELAKTAAEAAAAAVENISAPDEAEVADVNDVAAAAAAEAVAAAEAEAEVDDMEETESTVAV